MTPLIEAFLWVVFFFGVLGMAGLIISFGTSAIRKYSYSIPVNSPVTVSPAVYLESVEIE